MKKCLILLSLVTTCVGEPKTVDEPYLSGLDWAYLYMASNANGVIIDGVVEDEIPREEVLDTTSFKYKKNVKFYEIFNTDTTCVIPYLNYVYIVDFFGNYHKGERIRYDDFTLVQGFNSHRRDSDITFTWNDREYQYYWREHAYIRISDAKRMLEENTVIETVYPEEEEDDEEDDDEDYDEEDEE